MNRVVVTGLGIVSPVGCGVRFAWNNIKNGVSGVRKVDLFDVSDLASQIAGVPVRGDKDGDFNPDSVIDAREQRKMEKSILYGLVAADEAMRDSGLVDYNYDKERFGVSIGSGIGGLSTICDNCVELNTNGPRFISPFFIPKSIVNMTAGYASIRYGLMGPNISMATACATGAHSIIDAVRLIQRGDVDAMLAGGTEGAVTRIGLAGFSAMKALSTRNEKPELASRPWDKDRDGFVLSEGAGVLVLENYEHAVKRGAKIYAEIVGCGMSADAYHITAPAPNGVGGARAMKLALQDAKLKPQDVDYINAHGTSTGLGDVGELLAVREMFAGTNACMSSTKSMTGHLLGAAGAVEAIFSILSIRDNIVPPTINLENPIDEVVDFNLVPKIAQKKQVNVAMSNSFGFGGTNATLVFKKVK